MEHRRHVANVEGRDRGRQHRERERERGREGRPGRTGNERSRSAWRPRDESMLEEGHTIYLPRFTNPMAALNGGLVPQNPTPAPPFGTPVLTPGLIARNGSGYLSSAATNSSVSPTTSMQWKLERLTPVLMSSSNQPPSSQSPILPFTELEPNDRLPTLFHTLLRIITSPSMVQEFEMYFEHLPTHIRLSIMRYQAVYTTGDGVGRLGRINGEVLAIGTAGREIRDALRRQARTIDQVEDNWEQDESSEDWTTQSVIESSEDDTEIHTLVVLKPHHSLSLSLLKLIPIQLTHLALIAMPPPPAIPPPQTLIPFIYLPKTLPSLKLLDVSDNPWAKEKYIERWDLSKWAFLSIFIAKGCGISSLDGEDSWMGKMKQILWRTGRKSTLQVVVDDSLE